MTQHSYRLAVVLGAPGNYTILPREKADLEAGALSAVNGFAISWGSPTARDHPEAGSHRLEFEASPANAAALTLDTRINVNCLIDGVYTVNLLVAWVESADRHKTKAGRRRITPELADWYGRASATKLAALPWPPHNQVQRFQAINSASPSGLLCDWFKASDQITLLPRDVDNADALDVIRRTIAPQRAAAGYAGFKPIGLPGNVYNGPVTIQGTTQPATITPHPHKVITVPAAALEDTPEFLDRSSYITQARYSTAYWTTAGGRGDDVTLVSRNPNPQKLTASVWTVESDRGVAQAGTTLPSEISWVATANLNPTWARQPARVQLDQIDTQGLINLVGSDTRDAVILHIPDAPAGFDPYQTVIGGHLVGDYDQPIPLTLTVRLEPTRLTGARPMKFSDFPGPATAFPGLPARMSNQSPTVRISDLELVTIR